MYRIIYFFLLVGGLLCGSCVEKNDYKKKLEMELRSFKEMAITMPDNLQPQCCDEQTLPDTTLLYRPLKMVVYINKNGCADCKLRGLSRLYMFILENRHLDNFGVVVILNTPDIEASASTLRDIRFRQTVFYDPDGSFERLNPHLPTNEVLHTFLLNGENKVVLVGSPSHNERLKKRYLEELNLSPSIGLS